MRYATMIKSAVFLALLAAAGLLLGTVCKRVYQNNAVLFSPGRELLHLALWAFGAILLFAAAAGLVAALVRPLWLVILGFALTAAIIVVAWKISLVTVILGLVFIALAAIYARAVSRELDSRLDFSVRPLAEEQKTLLFVLALLVSVSFALGYAADARQRGYVIPPAYKQFTADLMLQAIKAQVGGALDLIPGMEAAMTAEFTRSLDQFWVEIEAKVKPYVPYIPVALAVLLFWILESLLGLVSWIPTLLLSMIFPLLSALGVTHTLSKTKEARRLTL